MNMYGGARKKPTMTRQQALAKAQAAAAEKFGFASFPKKGSEDAKKMMELVRSFKTNPKRITKEQAQTAFNKFYSSRGRYNKYHPGMSPARAAAQDRLRAMRPARIVENNKFARRPDLYDYPGVDVGRFAPRNVGKGNARMAELRDLRTAQTEAQIAALLAKARAARSKLTQDRRRGAARGLVGTRTLDTAVGLRSARSSAR